MQLADKNGALRPVLKVLTDYPRDDLAHDEVHQALIAACVARGLDCSGADVGAVPGLDTVVAGFKTAQLALNSPLGYGHVFHANCAPRKNIAARQSRGEKVVLGMTASGVALLVVNSGYALSLFCDSAAVGEIAFYQTDIPDAGSQFRSRDFFPVAMAELAAHLVARHKELGTAGIEKLLVNKDFGSILKGLSWLGEPLDIKALPRLPAGSVLYVDNFGNVKTHFRHDDLLMHYAPGDVLAVKIGEKVVDAVLGNEGFSQGEGMLALTAGSSGWPVKGKKSFFTELMLRGSSAARQFGAVQPGDAVTLLRESDLQQAVSLLHAADREAVDRLGLHDISEARVIAHLARTGLIRNGYDTTPLREALAAGDLPHRLS